MKSLRDQQDRRECVAAMYRANLPVKIIAKAFGVQPGTMHRFIYRMRQEGWELPRRSPNAGSRCIEGPREPSR